MKYLSTLFIIFFPAHLIAQVPKPDPPVINYVTINGPDQQVFIEWDHPDTTKVDGFVIHEYDPDPNKLDIQSTNVFVKNSSLSKPFYYDSVRFRPVKFRMQSYVGDYNSNPSQPSNYHSTMYTNSFFNTCTNTMTVKWTPYIGWGNKLTNYHIRNSGMTKTYATISASDTTYTFKATPDSVYTFVIVAASSDGWSSLSNIDTVDTDAPTLPSNIFGANASFISDNSVELNFKLDTIAEVMNYRLLKSNNPISGWETVTEFINYPQENIEYTDNLSSNAQTVYYKLDNLNTCGDGVVTSNMVSAIVPTYTIDNLTTVNLTWDAYLQWPQGLQGYFIFRSIDGAAPVLLNPLPTTSANYSDNMSVFAGDQLRGEVIYYIKSISQPDDLDIVDTSLSKKVRVDLTSQVYIPNAFTPNGDSQNDEFNAFFAFLPETFTMVIYDRYGFKVFETKNVTQGWNGYLRNKRKAPEATYIYFISFIDGNGRKIEKKGNFTLIYK